MLFYAKKQPGSPLESSGAIPVGRGGARERAQISAAGGKQRQADFATTMEGLYMVTKIISGEVVERRKSKITRRPPKRGGRIRGNSSEKKLVGNREYAKLALARTINCNFSAGDLWLTLKFDPEGLAAVGGTLEGARRAARKFIDRIAYRLKKRGLSVRWILAASEIDGETGEMTRPHVHVILPGDAFQMRDKRLWLAPHTAAGSAEAGSVGPRLREEAVEDIWGMGGVDVQFLRHQKDLYPLAAYIVNQARGVPDEKKWTCSRNMKKPVVRREIVTSGGQLRVPAGAVELPGTRYDPEKGQNMVRYIPKKRDPRKKVGGHKELAAALAAEEAGAWP